MHCTTDKNAQTLVPHHVQELALSDDENLKEFALQRTTPAVIRGIANDWPIVSAANHSHDTLFDYLSPFYHQGSQQLVGMGSVPAEYSGRLFYNEELNGFNFSRQSIDFPSFITRLKKAAIGDDDSDHYMGSTNVDHLLPNMRTQNNLNSLSPLTPLVSIWLSNQTTVAAHQDFPDNIAVCVAGKRRFTLFPPEQVANLYIGPLDKTPAGQAISLVDHRHPDFNQHPNYQKALQAAQVVELAPGDALFIPSLWWHSVESLAPINVLINYWWQKTPQYAGSPMDALLHAIMNISALSAQQKQAMSALFDEYVFNEHPEHFTHIPKSALGILAKDELATRQLRALLINKLNQ